VCARIFVTTGTFVFCRKCRCNAGWRQLEEEFATLQSRGAKASATSREGSRSNKAAAVETQCRLWNSALAIRITLQRTLVAHGCMLQDVPEAPDAVNAARLAAIGAIGDCMDTMHNLLLRVAPGNDGTSTQAAPSTIYDAEALVKSCRQSCAELWPQLEQLESRFSTFRDNETDRWHRKTLLATGQTALKGVGGLQALNKPLSQQVHDVLRAPEKALHKVRRQRTEHDSILCEGTQNGLSKAPRAATGGDSADTHVDLPGCDGAGAVIESNTSAEGHPSSGSTRMGAGETKQEWGLRRATVAEIVADSAHDPESFDDSAFYHVLLQEFLESAQAQRLMVDSFKARIYLSFNDNGNVRLGTPIDSSRATLVWEQVDLVRFGFICCPLAVKCKEVV
jgi:Apoptosis antagonizing transcription factor